MSKKILRLLSVAVLLVGFSTSIIAQTFNNVFDVDQPGSHRGTAVHQTSGLVYISNSSDDDVIDFQ